MKKLLPILLLSSIATTAYAFEDEKTWGLTVGAGSYEDTTRDGAVEFNYGLINNNVEANLGVEFSGTSTDLGYGARLRDDTTELDFSVGYQHNLSDKVAIVAGVEADARTRTHSLSETEDYIVQRDICYRNNPYYYRYTRYTCTTAAERVTVTTNEALESKSETETAAYLGLEFRDDKNRLRVQANTNSDFKAELGFGLENNTEFFVKYEQEERFERERSNVGVGFRLKF